MPAKLTISTPLGIEKEIIELDFLNPDQVTMIDKALLKVGEFGEVHLILEKGCLRFVVVQQSFDARRLQTE